MIEGWGRVGNYKEAEWYYKELKRLGFKPNSSNLYTNKFASSAWGWRRCLQNSWWYAGDGVCQYSSILGTLLKAYEKVGEKLYQKLKIFWNCFRCDRFQHCCKNVCQGWILERCSLCSRNNGEGKGHSSRHYMFRDMLCIYQKCGMVDKLKDLCC
jgi:pentatricopeptide repeat protein